VGYKPEICLGDGRPPVGFYRGSPVEDLGTGQVPPSWSSLQTLFTDFDCSKNDQNLKLSHKSSPDYWPVCFAVGLSDILGLRSFAPSQAHACGVTGCKRYLTRFYFVVYCRGYCALQDLCQLCKCRYSSRFCPTVLTSPDKFTSTL